MWPNRKIPYTYHINIAEVPKRQASVEKAIRKIEEDSCLEFEDITGFMDDYMQNHTAMEYLPNYFHLRPPPPEYQHYLL